METENSDARERVLEVAERLFSQRGYTAVTLRDIATELGIKHTSLYHHVPGGKEALFIEVTERSLERHRDGLSRALARDDSAIRDQLYAAADWLISQPPMDLIRMVYSDMPVIDQAEATRLSSQAFSAMIMPLTGALQAAAERGEVEHPNWTLIAGGLIGMIEAMHAVPEHVLQGSRVAMAHQLIDAFLEGLRPRGDSP